LGGAERVLLDLLDGKAPVVVVALEDGPLLDEVRARGHQSHVVGMPTELAGAGDASSTSALVRAGAASADVAMRLGRLLRRLDPRVLHTNGIKAHILGTVAAPAATRLVWHLHDFPSDRRVSSHSLRAVARVRRITRRVANSHAVGRDADRVLGPGRTDVVWNGVDLTQFQPEGEGMDAIRSSGALRFGLVATYARWKGHDVFLAAAATVERLRPGRAKFFIVGGPVYSTHGSQWSADELAGLARALNVEVTLVPFVNDSAKAIRSLDVVVHASTRPEPFGRVIVEGMACAKPVIFSDEGGAREIGRPEVDTLAFEARSADALAREMVRLLDDVSLRRRLASAASERAREFDVTRFRERVHGIWSEVAR
jgi:glycosyltransferase involved in cell wall biosynthesis